MDRLNADDYVTEALAVLTESGADSITIAVLCDRLRVTKGSFYHHFGGLPGFVGVLVTHWEGEHARRLTAVARAEPNAGLRLAALFDAAAASRHAVDAAMRVWGARDDVVAEAVVRVDRRWERAYTDAVVGLRIERMQARLLARTAASVVTGAQLREADVDGRRLRQMLDEVQRVIVADADPRRVTRLLAR